MVSWSAVINSLTSKDQNRSRSLVLRASPWAGLPQAARWLKSKENHRGN